MNTFTTRVWALMPLAVAVNVVMGKMVALLRIPLYLDSVGTILTAALCGPLPGALVGLTSIGVFALTQPTFFPFIGTAVALGLMAGWLAPRGFFSSPQAAAVAGLFVGTVAAVLSAPVSAYVFGGVTGGGTDLVVAFFRSSGRSKLEASLAQGLLSDPIDKMVTFGLVQMLLARLPLRFRQGFPLASVHGHLVARRTGPSGRASGRVRVTRSAQVYQEKASGWLDELTFLTKGLSLVLVLAMALTWPAIQNGVVAFPLPLLSAALFSLALSTGRGLGAARMMVWLWAPLAFSMTLINGLFGPAPLGHWGAVTYSEPGLAEGLGLSLRLLAVLLGVFLVLDTCSPGQLSAGLEGLGLPPKLTYVVLAAVAFIPETVRRAEQVQEAQRARGLGIGGSLWQRGQSLIALLGPVLLGGLADTETRALALEARGFGANRRRTRLEEEAVGGGEWLLRLALLGGTVWLLW